MRLRTTLFSLFLIAGFFGLENCSTPYDTWEGDPGGNGVGQGTGGDGVLYLSAKIGPEGGRIEITDSASPIMGAFLAVPPGALKEPVNLKISYHSGWKPLDVDSNVKAIALQPQDCELVKEIEVGIPIPKGQMESKTLFPFIFDAEDSVWAALPKVRLDKQKSIMVALTSKLSSFICANAKNEYTTELYRVDQRIVGKAVLKTDFAQFELMKKGAGSFSLKQVLDSLKEKVNLYHRVTLIEKSADSERKIGGQTLGWRISSIFNTSQGLRYMVSRMDDKGSRNYLFEGSKRVPNGLSLEEVYQHMANIPILFSLSSKLVDNAEYHIRIHSWVIAQKVSIPFTDFTLSWPHEVVPVKGKNIPVLPRDKPDYQDENVDEIIDKFETQSYRLRIHHVHVVDTPLIRIFTSVFNHKGEFIQGLAKKDFIIKENGNVKPASGLLAPGPNTVAGDYVLVLGMSGRFNGALKTAIRNSSAFFLNSLPSGCNAALVKFGAEIEASGYPGFQKDKSYAINFLKKKYEGGSSNKLWDAVKRGVGALKWQNNKRVMVVVVDGEDNLSLTSTDAIQKLLEDYHISLYLMAGGKQDTSLLKSMAEASGGKFFSVSTGAANEAYLNKNFTEILNLEKEQYLLTFKTEKALKQQTLPISVKFGDVTHEVTAHYGNIQFPEIKGFNSQTSGNKVLLIWSPSHSSGLSGFAYNIYSRHHFTWSKQDTGRIEGDWEFGRVNNKPITANAFNHMIGIKFNGRLDYHILPVDELAGEGVFQQSTPEISVALDTSYRLLTPLVLKNDSIQGPFRIPAIDSCVINAWFKWNNGSNPNAHWNILVSQDLNDWRVVLKIADMDSSHFRKPQQTFYGHADLEAFKGKRIFFKTEGVPSPSGKSEISGLYLWHNHLPANSLSLPQTAVDIPRAELLSTKAEGNRAVLTWNKIHASDFKYYLIYYSGAKDVSPGDSLLDSLPKSFDTVYTAKRLKYEASHYFKVYTEYADGLKLPSREASVTIGRKDSVNTSPYFENRDVKDTTAVGKKYSLTLTAYDDEEDQLVYTLLTRRLGMALNGQVLAWTPAEMDTGLTSIRVQAADGRQGFDTLNLNLFTYDTPKGQKLRIRKFTSNSISLEWSPSPAMRFQGYRLFRGDLVTVDSGSTMLASLSKRDDTTFTDEGVNTDKTMFYALYVTNDFGTSSADVLKFTNNSNMLPNSVALKVEDVDQSTVSLSWTRSDDPYFQYYRIHRDLNAGAGRTGTLIGTFSDPDVLSFKDTTVLHRTTYYYVVSVTNAYGTSPASQPVAAKTPSGMPDPVALNIDSVSASQVHMSWSRSDVVKFRHYRIYRSRTAALDSNSTKLAEITDPNSVAFTDSTISQNGAYQYTVYVTNDYGTSPRAAPKSVDIINAVPSRPLLQIGEATDSSIALSWDRSSAERFVSYRLYRSLSSMVDSMSNLVATISKVDSLQYTDFTVNHNTPYFYTLYAANHNGVSPPAGVVWKTTLDGTPGKVSLRVGEISDSTVDLSWNRSNAAGFTGYRLYRSYLNTVDSGNTLVATLGSVDDTSFTDNTVTHNMSYKYTVYVANKYGLSEKADPQSAQTPNAMPLANVLSVGSATDSSITLSWNPSEAVRFTHYRIYRSYMNTVDSTAPAVLAATIADPQVTTYTDESLPHNTVYFYALFVTNEYGVSPKSNILQANTEDATPTAVVLKTDGSSESSVSLSWTASTTARFLGYRIFRSSNANVDSSATLVATVAPAMEITYLDTDVEDNSEYYYCLYVTSDYGTSPASNAVSISTANGPPEAPVLDDPEVVSGTTTLRWSRNNEPDFSRYYIRYSTTSAVDVSSSLLKTITNRDDTVYADTTLAKNTQYWFRVYAEDDNLLYAGSNTVLNFPTMLSASNITQTSARLSWTAYAGSDFASYKIYRSIHPGVTASSSLVATIASQAVTSRDETGLDNQKYYYRIYMVESDGSSRGSNEIGVSVYRTFTDNRDGKAYNKIRIGTLTWMADNLNWTPSTGSSWCYDGNAGNCDEYGRLYDWSTAVDDAHGNGADVCPQGWHLPSDEEWKTLEIYLGLDEATADATGWRGTATGPKIKAETGWTGNTNTDDYGFAATPAGFRASTGAFGFLGTYSGFWTTTENTSSNAWSRSLQNTQNGIYRFYMDKSEGRSVRCVED